MNYDALFKAMPELETLRRFTGNQGEFLWKAEAYRYSLAYKRGIGRTPRAALANLYQEIHGILPIKA